MASEETASRQIRWTTLFLVVVVVLLFLWYIGSDRLTPFTGVARVQTYVIAVVPDQSAYVSEIAVKKNQLIEPGDPLIKLDKTRFQIAVEAAEAALQVAGQEVGASTAGVSTATAGLVKAHAQLKEVRTQSARIFDLEKKGIYAKARGDQARAAIETAEADVAAQEAELERAKELLGADGEENPRIRLAAAKLADARLNLERTTLVSPVRGLVGGLKIEVGTYANAGQPLISLVSIEDIWVEAFMTENNLALVAPGNKVELAFDAFPGQIFSGKVKSTAWGVSTGKAVNLGDLPTAEKPKGWLRDPQRFPVIIETTDYETSEDASRTGLRHNSQVDVIIYPTDSWFWNTLGNIWIRVVTWFSYLY